MKSLIQATAAASATLVAAFSFAAPSVYPTGTTIYEPEKAYSGYTVLSPLGEQAAVVIDMNGRVVKEWEGFVNSAGGPVRVLPGGYVMAANGMRPMRQESLELVERDFEGNVVWQFNHNEQIELPDAGTVWSARQHHDWQRADFPSGYYSPAFTPGIEGANTLLLTHTSVNQPKISDVDIQDDRFIEVSPQGDIIWEWKASDHVDELGFSDDARAAIRSAARRPNSDWLHVNSATYLGPNHWFDEGDERFAPDNIVFSSRQASLIAIVSHRDGSIVWRLGPDFLESSETRAIRQIIGEHHPHFIPEGLPGAGNLLVFDNGGASGYGPASAIAPNGSGIYARASSRVLEIDPVTLKLVWSYTGPGFYSTNISSAQRLPNGNTLIAEGANGRLFEVTSDRDIVWEYVHPVFAGARRSNAVYRAYRIPYDWIPQLDAPEEQAVMPPERGEFRVP